MSWVEDNNIDCYDPYDGQDESCGPSSAYDRSPHFPHGSFPHERVDARMTQEGYWQPASGSRVCISSMGDAHLANTIAYLERCYQHEVSQRTRALFTLIMDDASDDAVAEINKAVDAAITQTAMDNWAGGKLGELLREQGERIKWSRGR